MYITGELLLLYVYAYACSIRMITFCVTEDTYRKHINEKNSLGMGGNLAKAYGNLLHEMWSGNTSYTHPRVLKVQHVCSKTRWSVLCK